MSQNIFTNNKLSISNKEWWLRTYDQRESLYISQQLRTPQIIGQILSSRNQTLSSLNDFFEPRLKNLLPSPAIFKDMDKLSSRIVKAILNQEKIVLFSDYDVDGITSIAILGTFFSEIKVKYHSYIPLRHSEGYGASITSFEKVKELYNPNLIICLDSGTVSFEALDYAQQQNIDVIVIDHHEPDTTLPLSCALVNPKRKDCPSNHQYLCTGGLVFIATVALNQQLKEINYYNNNTLKTPNIIELLSYVALATVCDVMPLIGLNRAFVKQGLKQIAFRRDIGITTMLDEAKINHKPTAFDLGFILGPQINASGRINDALVALKLLTTKSKAEALKILNRLKEFNEERKSIEEKIYNQSIPNVETQIKNGHKVIIASGSDWNSGVLGIVASRLKERYHLPSIVISYNDQDIGTGSCRSILGVDIGKVILQAKNRSLLLKGGGHSMAAGFSLSQQNEQKFIEFINNNVLSQIEINKKITTPHILVDAIVSANGITNELYKYFEKMEPFGEGNPPIKLIIKNAIITFSKIIGNNKNSITCKIQTLTHKELGAIAFKCTQAPLGKLILEATKTKRPIQLLGTVHKNIWQGYHNLQFIIEDASPSLD